MQESNVRFLPCNWTWNLGNFGKVMSALSWYGSMMFVPLSYAIWVIFIFTWFCCTLLLCKSRFRDVVLDVCPSLHGWSIPVSQYIVTLQNQTSIKWLIYISISARLFFFFFFSFVFWLLICWWWSHLPWGGHRPSCRRRCWPWRELRLRRSIYLSKLKKERHLATTNCPFVLVWWLNSCNANWTCVLQSEPSMIKFSVFSLSSFLELPCFYLCLRINLKA